MFATQLQEAVEEPLFFLPAPVLEWIAQVTERQGEAKGSLAKLLVSLEAFIEKVSPEVRRSAERDGTAGSWWPAVSAASKLPFEGRKAGLTTDVTEPPRYSGKFNPELFRELLRRIHAEAEHGPLIKLSAKALELTPG
jgi:hypothetical protein